MAKATQKQTRTWILTVMARQAVTMSTDQVEIQARLSLPAFIARFPADCFCAASADAVCATERYWNEAKVTQALETWQRANAPVTSNVLPPEADAAPLSMDGKLWLIGWYRADTDPQAERSLELMRAKSDEAFGWLIKNDVRAADIAVWRKWVPRSRTDLAADWDDEAGVRRLAARIATEAPMNGQGQHGFSYRGFLLQTLARAVSLHAPQHGPAMFDELRWIAAGSPSEAPEIAAPAVDIDLGMFGDRP